jgi:hypothetical protein
MDTLFDARLLVIGNTKITFSLPSMLQNFMFMPGHKHSILGFCKTAAWLNKRKVHHSQPHFHFILSSGSTSQSFLCWWIYTHFLNHTDDATQAISYWPLTKTACAQTQASQCGICDEQSSTGTGFSPSTLVFSFHYHSTNAPHTFIYYQCYIIFATDSTVK